MKSFNQLVRHEGNHDLFLAVEMSVAALSSGHPFHIHTEGLRGTGKTTILRSAASILPPITRIKGCLYNCDPEQPHCPGHRGLSIQQIEAIGREEIPCPFLEISHGAKIGTIVGSIDLAKLTDPSQPMAALLPGTIPQAHRGIIFVDEINRLADASPEIADVLLDVMGTKPGRIQIEESGLPTVEMPVQVAVWAASNPDEEPGALSQIRKQLSDRFDMAVGMGRPSEVQSVLEILMSRSSRSGQQPSITSKCIPSIHVNDITVDDDTQKLLAAIYVDYGLESLRAIEAMETAAKLNALLNGQDRVSTNDISQIVPLVLSHRADPATIANILKYLRNFGELNKSSLADNFAAGNIPVDAARQSRCINPPHCTTKSRLADWWGRVREKLSRQNNENKKETTTQRSKSGSAENRAAGSGSGGKQIADPTQVNIIAPPNVAAPLSRLSLDEFVNTDEKFRSDR
ncbi:magnesium chelatase [Anaerosporomusa subterranea]|uniref:Magnesium chelatase n=1 Tax=Anaerosporomusa subterranea TaxID=1794912 RepID=A0A154BUI8_ANASB|nr:magnesium chelatase [Anaerosporomusa subterranea]KYZ77567.1 magnesium chelatase [Anaerosporomusa subterranea]